MSLSTKVPVQFWNPGAGVKMTKKKYKGVPSFVIYQTTKVKNSDNNFCCRSRWKIDLFARGW